MIQTHEVPYDIGREGESWMVMQTNGSGVRPVPGQHHLAWRLSKQAIERGVVAHLQFTDPAFVQNRKDEPGLDEHWTARLDSEHPELKLELQEGARGRTFYYAVMIIDDGVPHWAMGHNPPPKIEVGG